MQENQGWCRANLALQRGASRVICKSGGDHGRESIWPHADRGHGTARPARSYQEMMHATGNWDIAKKNRPPQPCRAGATRAVGDAWWAMRVAPALNLRFSPEGRGA